MSGQLLAESDVVDGLRDTTNNGHCKLIRDFNPSAKVEKTMPCSQNDDIWVAGPAIGIREILKKTKLYVSPDV